MVREQKWVRQFACLFSITLLFSGCVPSDEIIKGDRVSLEAELRPNMDTLDFLTQSVRSRTYRMIQLKKSGNLKYASEVRIPRLPEGFGYRGGSYPGTNGTCGVDIDEDCLIELSFEPQSAAAYGGTMEVIYQGRTEQKSLSVELKGKGTDNASLRFSLDGFDPVEGPLDFGTFGWGTSGTRTVHVLYFGVYTANNVQFEFPGSPFSVVGNSCPTNISANCQIELSYSGAIVEGLSNDNIRVTYNNGAFAAQSTVPTKGFTTDRIYPAEVRIDDEENWGRRLVGSGPYEARFTLELAPGNSVNATQLVGLAPTNTDFRYKGGAFPGTGGSCGNFLSNSCEVVVEYDPSTVRTIAGTDSGVFEFDYFDGIESQTVAVTLTGRGVGPAQLAISPKNVANPPDPWDFGAVSVDYWAVRTFVVTNSNYSLDATAIGFSMETGGQGFARDGSGCTSLGEGASCEVKVRFQPGIVSPTMLDRFVVSWASGNGQRTVDWGVQGEGDAKALLILSPTSRNFGTVLNTLTKDQTLNIDHYGTNPAEITNLQFASGGVAYSFVGGSFPGTGSCAYPNVNNSLVGNRRCTYKLRFSPTADISYDDSLALTYNDGEGGTVTRTLNLDGHGGIPADLEIKPLSPTTIDFGDTPKGLPVTQTFTINNKTGTDAPASSLAFTYPTGYSRNGGSCGNSVPKGGECTVVVQLDADSVGTKSGTFSVTYDNGIDGGHSATKSLTGEVTAPAVLVLSPQSRNFGNTVVGNDKQMNITVKYYGADAATITNSTFPSRFSYESGSYPGSGGTCGTTISADCTLSLRYSPTDAVSSSGTFTLTYNDGTTAGLTETAQLSGQGQSPANLSFNDGMNYAFSTTLVGDSRDKTFTVLNSGDATATSLAVIAPTGPFSVVGGTCDDSGRTVAGGATCTVKVRYRPTDESQTGPDALTIQYENGTMPAGAAVTSISLSGTALDAASLSLVTSDFDTISFGGATSRIVTVTNGGTAIATAVTPTLNPSAGPFVLNSSAIPSPGKELCTTTLPAGDSCEIHLVYTSTRPEARTLTLSVAYSDSRGVHVAEATLNARAVVPPKVATNGEHSCGINDIGEVKCWGHNNAGQLGIGNTTTKGDQGGEMNSLTAVPLGSDRYAKEVAVGFWHACAILDNDDLKCWGGNDAGQAGAGSTDDAIGDNPGEVAALGAINLGTGRHAVALSLGYAHSCAILDNGDLKCWGLNQFGQLGVGDNTNRGRNAGDMGDALPAVALDDDVIDVSASTGHTCAVTTAGEVKCWGTGYIGHLGTGNLDDTNEPTTAVNMGSASQAVTVAAGGGFTCAGLQNGDVKCWGRNDSAGNLGYLYCQNSFGEIGLCSQPQYPDDLENYGNHPSQFGTSLQAIDLGSTGPLEKLVAGNTHVCALFANGTSKCWGANSSGQLALGDAAPRGADQDDMGNALPFTALPPGFSIDTMSSGHDSVCVKGQSGGAHQVYCWGANSHGVLGRGNTNAVGADPGEVGSNMVPVSF